MKNYPSIFVRTVKYKRPVTIRRMLSWKSERRGAIFIIPVEETTIKRLNYLSASKISTISNHSFPISSICDPFNLLPSSLFSSFFPFLSAVPYFLILVSYTFEIHLGTHTYTYKTFRNFISNVLIILLELENNLKIYVEVARDLLQIYLIENKYT